MRDHFRAQRAGRRPQGTVGVRDLKAHAARIVRDVRDARASFVVTHRGRAVGVILPIEMADLTEPLTDDLDASDAWQAFLAAGRRLERRFRSGVSGVALLSKARR
jgi:prevent-host-death family protein